MTAATDRSMLHATGVLDRTATAGRSSLGSRGTWIRLALVVVGAIALVGCQLDVSADVVVQPDGSGQVIVRADADAELVEQVPTLADDLVLDDFVDAGWLVDGPTPTPDGGLALTLTHDFEGNDEATNLLRSLGPPFNDVAIGRREDGDTATNTVRGNLGLSNGFASFADDDTNAEEVDGDRLQWIIPTDGSILEASAQTEQAPSNGTAWARPVATLALVALIAWVAFMTVFIGYVALARSRRARRYRRRALP